VSGVSATVIVCAWTEDRWHQLNRALDSALAQVPPPAEVLLVVDHNPTLTARVRAHRPDLRVLANARAKGLSGARNTGLHAARGDVVAFLDDDAEAEPGWLTGHLTQYTDPTVVAVGGDIQPRWLGERPRWFPGEFGWVVGCTWTGLAGPARVVRNPIGANMSFRRAEALHLGGFDELLGRRGDGGDGAEETELAIRATACGFGHVVHEPSARVMHDVPQDRARWTYFRRRCLAEGRSKAAMVRRTGSVLASERDFVRRILPRGLLREAVQALRQRSYVPLLRAGAMVAGLTFTTTGFLLARANRGEHA